MRSLRFLFDENIRLSRRLTNRSNEEWLELLHSDERESALEELRTVIVQGLRAGLGRSLDKKGALEQIEDFAQDSLLRILDNLDSFRGDSKFTTWAQKVAVRVAYSELRRKRWANVSLDRSEDSNLTASSWENIPDRSVDPERAVSGQMAVDLVTGLINTELTELQRTAFHGIIVQGLPMEEVARQLGTNRNALYKLLHDARKRLKNELLERGIDAEQLVRELSD